MRNAARNLGEKKNSVIYGDPFWTRKKCVKFGTDLTFRANFLQLRGLICVVFVSGLQRFYIRREA